MENCWWFPTSPWARTAKRAAAPPLTWRPRRKRRNGFTAHFVERAKALGIRKVETGEFGAYMEVLCQNDGPVNLFIDTEKIGK